MRKILSCFALFASAPTALFAQTATPQAATEAEAVSLTFAPPLDVPLRYRVAQSRARTGLPTTKSDWVEVLRYARSGDGFVLQWKIDGDSVQGPLGDPATAALLQPFTGDPIAFDVDEEGEVLRARDWDRVRPRLLALVDTLAKAPGRTEDDVAAFAQVRSLFEAITAEQAPDILLKSIKPALGWGGVSMQAGESNTTTAPVMLPVFQVPVERSTTLTLEAVTPAELRFRILAEIDGESLRAMMGGVAERMGIDPESDKGREMRTQLAQMASNMVDTSVATFDRDTALPRHLRNERRAVVSDKSLVQTLEITRID